MKHAIFTIVQDEPFFFRLWHKYYRGHYAPNNMYVLYHPLAEEGDAGPEWLRIPVFKDTNVVRVFRDKSFDHTWLREQVQQFAAFLLGSYDTVTFTEVDEIITPDLTKVKDRNLLNWLEAWCHRDQATVRCTGFEVVHRIGQEPDLDAEEALRLGWHVLEHRGWWYPSWAYSKALTWREPPQWDNGFHQTFDRSGALFELPQEPELLLLHLHKVDYRIALERLKRTAKRNWHEPDAAGWTGIQNRFTDEAQLQWWWFRNIDDITASAADLVPIPSELRDVI